MKWIMRAREKGAKLISVDPRFTQTSAKADLYAPLRSGTDIAFLGGMINYILTNNLFSRSMLLTTPTPRSWSTLTIKDRQIWMVFSPVTL